MMISEKFGCHISFSYQESLDVFSLPISEKYDFYVKEGPIDRAVLEYVCEMRTIPSTNYSFEGFRRFLSFEDSKKLTTKILEV